FRRGAAKILPLSRDGYEAAGPATVGITCRSSPRRLWCDEGQTGLTDFGWPLGANDSGEEPKAMRPTMHSAVKTALVAWTLMLGGCATSQPPGAEEDPYAVSDPLEPVNRG